MLLVAGEAHAVAEVTRKVADPDQAVAVGDGETQGFEKRLGEGAVLPGVVLPRIFAGGGGGEDRKVGASSSACRDWPSGAVAPPERQASMKSSARLNPDT